MSSKEKKAEIIDQLQDAFAKCSVAILTDYRGLSAAEITALRRKLGDSGIGYRVVKNTLARFAAERVAKNELVSFFEGPVALAFGYDDIAEPAKMLYEYIRDSKASLSIKGGFIGDRVLTAADVMTLSSLPSKEILVAMVLGGMQAPISGLVNCLIAPMRGIMGVLQARIQQLEGE